MYRKLKKTASVLIKLAVTGAALWLVTARLDPREILSSMLQINPFWPFMAWVYYNLSQIVSAYRLQMLLRARGVNVPGPWNVLLYYIGLFYNMFLPGGLGGDGYKVYALNKVSGVKVKSLLLIMVLDRMSGVVALTNIASWLLVFSDFAEIYKIIYIFPLVTGIIAFIYVFAVQRWFRIFMPVVFPVLKYAFILQGLQTMAALFLAEAFQETGSITEYLNYISLFLVSAAAAMMPITIGGAGAREVVYYYGFSVLNYEPLTGVTYSFMLFLMVAVTSLSGVIFLPWMERTLGVRRFRKEQESHQ